MKRIGWVFSDNNEGFPLGPVFETREEAAGRGREWYEGAIVYTGLMMRVEAEDVVAALSCPIDVECWAEDLEEFHEKLALEIRDVLRKNEKRIQEAVKKRLAELLKFPCQKIACFEVREIERHEPVGVPMGEGL